MARLFEPLASVLLDAVDLKTGESVLDVACGPGSVTRLAARRVGVTGRVAGCDISPDMIAVARSKEVEERSAAIEYAVSPADALPFGDATFDAITCQQGLQFFPDKVAALSEMRRVVRPGGRTGIVVFRPPDGARFFTTLRDALRRSGVAEVDALPSGPFEYGSVLDLRGDLAAAGFGSVTVEERVVPVIFDVVDAAVAAVRGTPFGPILAGSGPEAAAAFEKEARSALARFADGEVVRIDQHCNLAIARP